MAMNLYIAVTFFYMMKHDYLCCYFILGHKYKIVPYSKTMIIGQMNYSVFCVYLTFLVQYYLGNYLRLKRVNGYGVWLFIFKAYNTK